MRRQRAGAAVMVAWVLGMASLSAGAAPALRVQVRQPGSFALIGNTLAQDCAAGTPLPFTGTVGNCGLSTTTADSAPDVFWRADAPNAGQALADNTVTAAQARSTAVLQLPPGAQVTQAYLYWAATATAGADSGVTLERPGVFSVGVNALESLTSVNNSYRAVADVTALVQAQGPGAYRVGDVDAVNLVDLNNNNAFAGWWMVVLYRLDSEPLRALAIYDGLDAVSNGAAQTATVTGFLVPAAGIAGTLGVVGLEGDRTLSGDSLYFNGSALSDAQNPANNFFNSTRSALGAAVSVSGDLPQLAGTPGSESGLDLDVVDVSPLLAAGQTAASVQASSTGDVYYLATLVTAINDDTDRIFADGFDL